MAHFLPEEDLNLDAYRADAKEIQKQKQKWDKLLVGAIYQRPPTFETDLVCPFDDDCIIPCRKSASKQGHKVTEFNGKSVSCHRFSWMYHHGLSSIPEKNQQGQQLLIRHMCNNGGCMNPNHLRSGTHESNSDDLIKAGLIRRGDSHTRAKIPEEVVRKIYALKRPKSHPQYMTQKQRAEIFNVPVSAVCDIDIGVTYNHITGVSKQKSQKRQSSAKKRREALKNRAWSVEQWTYAKNVLEEKSIVKDDTVMYNNLPCREWNGTKKNTFLPYGQVNVNGVHFGAHELSCIIGNGCKPPPRGSVVSHLCHNSLCVEPKHLKFDSPTGNMQESARSGRLQKILTAEQVSRIRQEYYLDPYCRTRLHTKYGVSDTCIRKIAKFECWTHVTDENIEALFAEYCRERNFEDPRPKKKAEDEENARSKPPPAYIGIFGTFTDDKVSNKV